MKRDNVMFKIRIIFIDCKGKTKVLKTKIRLQKNAA